MLLTILLRPNISPYTRYILYSNISYILNPKQLYKVLKIILIVAPKLIIVANLILYFSLKIVTRI